MLLVSFLLSGYCPLANAALVDTGKTKVYYGGIVFPGKSDDARTNSPYSFELATNKGGDSGELSVALLNFFKNNSGSMKHIDLSFDLSKEGESKVVMALAVTGEEVGTELIADVNKVIVDLSCQVLFLDFAEKKVLGAYPLFLEYVAKSDGPPSREFILNAVRKTYLDPQESIFDLLKTRMGDFRIARGSSRTVRVSKVWFEDEAITQLKELGKGKKAYENQIAQRYGDALFSGLGITMLPYMKDGANSKMALRMSDGRSVMFDIPPSTYSIDLTLRKFKKVLKEETSVEMAYIYGAFITVKVYEPEYMKIYFEENIKHGEMKIVPRSQLKWDEFLVYNEVLRRALNDSVEMMRNNKNTFEEVIKRCSVK